MSSSGAAPPPREQSAAMSSPFPPIENYAFLSNCHTGALVGQSTRFTRQDGVEETWRIMQPLLDAPPPVHAYAQGSWGPAAADEIVAGFGRWHTPWLAS